MDLIARGVIPRDESIVVCVTGNGYKTAEVVEGKLTEPVRLTRAFKDFESWWAGRSAEVTVSGAGARSSSTRSPA
jgi:threonine synthase